MQCFVTCFAERIGVLDAYGTLIEDEFRTFVQYVSRDKNKNTEVTDTCKAVEYNGPNQCEYMFQVYDCIVKGFLAKNIRGFW